MITIKNSQIHYTISFTTVYGRSLKRLNTQ